MDKYYYNIIYLEIEIDSSDLETDYEEGKCFTVIAESSSTSGYESDVDAGKINKTRTIKDRRGKHTTKKDNKVNNKIILKLIESTESSGSDSGVDDNAGVTDKKTKIIHRKSSFKYKQDVIHELDSNESGDETLESSKLTFYEQSMEHDNTEGGKLSKDCKSEGLFFSHAIQQGLKLSKRCVIALTNQFRASIKKIFTDFYTEFKHTKDLQQLLKKEPKKYKQGSLSIDSSHGALCRVKNDTDGIESILISGRSKCGVAFTDDDVVVEILNNETLKHRKRTQTTLKVYGEVIGVLERKRKRSIEHPIYVCELDSFDNDQVRPICKTIPKIQLVRQNRNSGIFSVDIYKYNPKTQDLFYDYTLPITPSRRRKFLFYVVFISWTTIYPVGVVIHIHKPTKTPLYSGKEIFDLQYEVPTIYKRETVELTRNALEVNFHALTENRADLTQLKNIFTVDPKGTAVLDDAINIDRLQNALYRVGVHIADVTAFILPGDAIDTEAKTRGTTFYAGKFSKPHCMLPEPLSIDTCSLLPGRTRLTKTIFLYFDKQLKFIGHRFLKSFIRSSEQMTYHQVQRIIEGNSSSLFKTDLELLLRIATMLRQKRFKNASRAVKYEYEITKGLETETNCFEAYYLIEEFMVLANEVVANFLMKLPHVKECVPLRCQDAAATKHIQEWLSSYPKIADQIVQLQNKKPLQWKEINLHNFETIGRKIRYVDISFIQKWIWNEFKNLMSNGNYVEASKLICTDEIHPFQALALDEWFRLQEHAEYRCSGNVSKLKGSHFGLNKYPYVHFTAPIRRYLDIVVHRLLDAALEGKREMPYNQKDIIEYCKTMTEVSAKAKQYETRCKSLIFANEIKNQPVMVYAFVKTFTDQDVTFVLPGLRFLSEDSTTLSLQHLGVCCQPDFKRDMEKENLAANRDILVLNWERRLYSTLKWRPRPKYPITGYNWADEDEPQRIDPHQRMEVQQLDTWLKCLRTACKEGNLKECAEQFRDKNIDNNCFRYVSTTFNTEFDVSSELEKVDTKKTDDNESKSIDCKPKKQTLSKNKKNGNKREVPPIITKQACKFSMTFSHGQVVALQLSANIQKGILMPYLQIVDMTENVKFCIEHMRDPVFCLEKYSVQKTKRVYKSVEEYQGIWLPLIQMEAVMGCVQADTIVINETYVMFGDHDGHFYLGTEFCDERNIDVGETGIRFLDVDIDTIPKEDRKKYYVPKSHYLCIRCPIAKKQNDIAKPPDEKQDANAKPWRLWRPDDYFIWSSHAKITHVNKSKEKGSTLINFSLRKNAASPPHQLRENKTKLKCCVEILPKTPIDM